MRTASSCHEFTFVVLVDEHGPERQRSGSAIDCLSRPVAQPQKARRRPAGRVNRVKSRNFNKALKFMDARESGAWRRSAFSALRCRLELTMEAGAEG
jgi:hypothetical protein